MLHAYGSTWLPATLLQRAQRPALVDSLVAASRHWRIGLHFNKGLAGASPEIVAAARDTAVNPASNQIGSARTGALTTRASRR